MQSYLKLRAKWIRGDRNANHDLQKKSQHSTFATKAKQSRFADLYIQQRWVRIGWIVVWQHAFQHWVWVAHSRKIAMQKSEENGMWRKWNVQKLEYAGNGMYRNGICKIR